MPSSPYYSFCKFGGKQYFLEYLNDCNIVYVKCECLCNCKGMLMWNLQYFILLIFYNLNDETEMVKLHLFLFKCFVYKHLTSNEILLYKRPRLLHFEKQPISEEAAL